MLRLINKYERLSSNPPTLETWLSNRHRIFSIAIIEIIERNVIIAMKQCRQLYGIEPGSMEMLKGNPRQYMVQIRTYCNQHYILLLEVVVANGDKINKNNKKQNQLTGKTSRESHLPILKVQMKLLVKSIPQRRSKSSNLQSLS